MAQPLPGDPKSSAQKVGKMVRGRVKKTFQDSLTQELHALWCRSRGVGSIQTERQKNGRANKTMKIGMFTQDLGGVFFYLALLWGWTLHLAESISLTW